MSSLAASPPAPCTGHLALAIASAFTGAAVYVSVVEQPARLLLQDGALLAQWKPAYKRGAVMQASLSMIGAAVGFFTAYKTKDWRWNVGATLLFLGWPYTFLVVMPINNQLLAIEEKDAGAKSRSLIEAWGVRHAVRSALGGAAVAAFVWALCPCKCAAFGSSAIKK